MNESLLDIPRVLTGLTEWGACVVYVLLVARRRRIAATLAVVLLAGAGLIAAQLWAGTLPLALWVPGMLIAAAGMFALLASTLQVTAVTAGYLTARAFVLGELVASAGWQVARFYHSGDDEVPRTIVYLLVAVPALAAAWAVERRHLRRGDDLRVSRGELAGAIAIATATFAISNLSFVAANTPFSGRLGPDLLYIRTLVDLCGFIALYLQHRVRGQLVARRDADAMTRMLRSQHEQYEISRRAIDEVNRRYHDMKHHIDVLRAEADASTRARMLDELEGSLDAYGASTRTGNRVLDAVLTAKRMYAEEHDVHVSYVADGALLGFLRPLDLAAIVGNALDNAVEASIRVADRDNRLVRLALFSREDFVILRVENTYDGVLRHREGKLVTLKDRDGHGYGVRSIEATVAEYGGSVTFTANDRMFTLSVLFPAAS